MWLMTTIVRWYIGRRPSCSDYCVVEAEIADVDEAGKGLLVTQDGVLVQFPVEMLYPVGSAEPPAESQSFCGGVELTRDFHPAVGARRTSLRWLSLQEVEQLIVVWKGA